VRRLRSMARRVLLRLDRALGTELDGGLRLGRALPSKLGLDGRERARIFLASVLLSTHRLHRPVRIRVRGPQGPRWFVVPDWAGLRVLEEVFCFGEYGIELPREPRRILDLGSNIGASILYFALRYPRTPIVGAEPSRNLFPILRANVGDLPNVTLHNIAVSERKQPIVFYEGTASWSGSTRPSEWAPADGGFEVEGVPLDDLLRGSDVDLVKIDIEGGEFDVLPESHGVAEVEAVLGEIHAPPGTPDAERLLALFSGHIVQIAPPEWSGGAHTVFSAVRPPT
jgi:FkbM family methyltransferase